MIYKVTCRDGLIRFYRNKGWTELQAGSETEAAEKTWRMFGYTRNVKVKGVRPGRYRIVFDVSFDYNITLLRTVELALRAIKHFEDFQTARWLDRYIVLTIRGATGRPDWLSVEDLDKESNLLRMAAVSAREVANPSDFVDIDIAIFNYLELNSKEGFKSRVIRKSSKKLVNKTAK